MVLVVGLLVFHVSGGEPFHSVSFINSKYQLMSILVYFIRRKTFRNDSKSSEYHPSSHFRLHLKGLFEQFLLSGVAPYVDPGDLFN